MHELAIASSILDAVRTESARHAGRASTSGGANREYSGVASESLQFCFDALVKDSGPGAAGAGYRGLSRGRRRARGELDLSYLEIEEPETA